MSKQSDLATAIVQFVISQGNANGQRWVVDGPGVLGLVRDAFPESKAEAKKAAESRAADKKASADKAAADKVAADELTDAFNDAQKG